MKIFTAPLVVKSASAGIGGYLNLSSRYQILSLPNTTQLTVALHYQWLISTSIQASKITITLSAGLFFRRDFLQSILIRSDLSHTATIKCA